MNQNAALLYGAQQVNTASPAKMVHMLYDRTISFLYEAVQAIEAGNIQGRCNANCRAIELLSHLSNTLDMDSGGQIAANLEELYHFSMMHLMKVDRNNDPQAARDVIELLTPLRDSWAQLADRGTDAMRREVQNAQNGTQSAPVPGNSGNEGTTAAPMPSGVSISA